MESTRVRRAVGRVPSVEGFSDVRRVGQAGDLGVDIRCKDDIGRLVVAQCKRYRARAKIGSPEIQTFFGMTARARAARGIFVTSSTFTGPARRLAYELDIDLVDGSQIGAFYREKIRREEAERQRQLELQRVLEAARVAEATRIAEAARQRTASESFPVPSPWSETVDRRVRTKAQPAPVALSPPANEMAKLIADQPEPQTGDEYRDSAIGGLLLIFCLILFAVILQIAIRQMS
ncbi:MAG: restriction endonuclease [Thermomicrobiales bacterium]